MIKNILNKITGTHLGILVILMFFTAQVCYADNEISIDQTGDNLELTVLQEGNNNEITINQIGNYFNLNINQIGNNNIIKGYDYSSYIEGNDMDLMLVQYNETTTNNVVDIWHLDGDDNTVRWAQGAAWDNATSETYSYDGDEGGGHYARLDIHGDNNHMQGHQTNQGSTSGHTFTSLIFSDYNDIWARQQHDGAKTINLQTNSDGNDITLRQKVHGHNTQQLFHYRVQNQLHSTYYNKEQQLNHIHYHRLVIQSVVVVYQ